MRVTLGSGWSLELDGISWDGRLPKNKVDVYKVHVDGTREHALGRGPRMSL